MFLSCPLLWLVDVDVIGHALTLPWLTAFFIGTSSNLSEADTL